VKGSLLTDLGLRSGLDWLRDPWLYAAAAAAIPLLLLMHLVLDPAGSAPERSAAVIVSFVLWQPAVEEVLFRGVIQGRLRETAIGQRRAAGITGANLLTSLAFAAVHGVHHPPLWALAVLVPSLVFGSLRDRHGSIYPGLALHMTYNVLYLLTGFS
jgi:membrane protease YdiL (CAAX protease family)